MNILICQVLLAEDDIWLMGFLSHFGVVPFCGK